MSVHLYTITWNEEAMLGFFFRHYDPVVDQYVVHDDGSTDDTLAILKAHPKVEVRPLRRAIPDSYTLSGDHHRNTIWKESRGSADWVILTAIDEHLTHPDLPGYLGRCKAQGITLLPALGYQMVSHEFPDVEETLARTRTMGAPYPKMSKLSIFDPEAVEETNFGPGRHRAEPTGRVHYPARDEILNLHYKFLGRDFLAKRFAQLAGGAGQDKRSNIAKKYRLTEDEITAQFEALERDAIDLSDPYRDVVEPHLFMRWWRDMQESSRNHVVVPEATEHNDLGDLGRSGDRGVWMPRGQSAMEIATCAGALERDFGIPPYLSRVIVSRVLSALSYPASPDVSAPPDTPLSPSPTSEADPQAE